MSYKHKFRLEKLPEEMAAHQATISKTEAVLAEADLFTKNPEKFDKAAKALEAAKTQLAAAEEEWLELEMLREEVDANK